jgi:radical SAM/Cys-rich protein
MHATLPLLEITDFPNIVRKKLSTLQVNLGYRCNQSCVHCHVNAGPNRSEMMQPALLELIPDVIEARGISTLDLTGGAPELHEGFRGLVRALTGRGVRVIDRCNLTILLESGQENLAEFLADQGVEIVASLPCYSLENVERQRGQGVFDKSIAALRKLNALGYGKEGSGLVLNLVYNPLGPCLPPSQEKLKEDYGRELFARFGIVFNDLYTIANMPIQRFGSMLISKGQFNDYMKLLRDNHHSENVEHVMCRSLISVDWQGFIYDCDFNQQLGLSIRDPRFNREPPHIRDLLKIDPDGANIVVAEHCFGCTAGSGSSCGGSFVTGKA